MFPREEGKHFYGNGIEALGEELKDIGGSRGILFASRQFASEYSKPDLDRLKAIRWSHVKHLMGVKDPKTRAVLERRCIEGGWNAKRLEQHIRERQGKRSHGGSKPTSTVPIGPKNAVNMLGSIVDRWQADFDRWIGSDLERLLADFAVKNRLSVRALAERLRNMKSEIGQASTILTKLAGPE